MKDSGFFFSRKKISRNIVEHTMFIQVFIHVHVTIAPKSFKDLFKNDILKKYIYICKKNYL